MPREPGRNLRQEAERKVERRFAQQSEALFASDKEQRERDLRAQQHREPLPVLRHGPKRGANAAC